MAGIIEFEFDPGQTVWVIDSVASCAVNDTVSAVREGTVIQVRAAILQSTEPLTGSPLVYDTVTYDIRIGTLPGTKSFSPGDVFASLTDAITEYQTRV